MSIYQKPKGSILHKIIIVALIGVLIYVLYEPFEIREREDALRRESRARMTNIRAGQLQFINKFGKYAPSVDSLIAFIKEEVAAGTVTTETFKPLALGPFVPESLAHSPKSFRPYVMTSVDTTIIKKYILECPDGYGSIGSLTDDSRINKASWE
ncbi:MAG: hypothetical protein FJ215_06975 [Ignavibacteria bacterium]|nr:hypothetical protein [Ignavibacteria bacterium]